MQNKEWLVEIRLKAYEPSLPGGSRIITFEEVLAVDEYTARHSGFQQFETRCNYEPIMRRKMSKLKITSKQCCAPEAIEI